MFRSFTYSFLLICFLIAPAQVIAADKNTQKKVNSSKQAANIVKKQYGGKVLKVNKQKNDRYKVKFVKPNGQVVSKKVNAKTGKIEKK